MNNYFLTRAARTQNEERKEYTINGIGKTGRPTCKRMKVDHYLIPYTNINAKQIKQLHIKPENTGFQFLEEN